MNLDPRFVDYSDLHILNLTDKERTPVTVINAEQTRGSDWLLLSAVNDSACDTFPSPYDNDYRGADDDYPDGIPSRFEPDKPVFAQLPDMSFALFDSRMILDENTLDNPKIDGGGETVLRSMLRVRRNGIITKKYGWAEEYFACESHFVFYSLFLLSHPILLNCM